MNMPKKVFTEEVKDDLGQMLWDVQSDLEPANWKPMPSIGAGVRELRAKDASGIYRVIYVVKIADKVHVLHAF